ncbi:MAG: CehA/McbA family metallohydrolase, partial [Acidobacteria bacterium]|nr:CehA/McbA family metallohydrolase [Acidobacteriota bacterium]
PVVAGGYHVIAADVHVHAFPGDGALPPWELAREAARRGLHAIVVSNHNQTFAARLGGAALEGSRLPIVIPAQEITTPRFHLIAAGINRTIDWRLPELDIVRAVHAQGGVVIAAHPVDQSWKGSDAMLAAIDAAEVAHPLTGMLETGRDELTAFFQRARAVNPGIAPIGSSDFHMVAPLGVCRTYVFAAHATRDGVLDAIRAGRTVAEDQDGVLYGDPALTLLLDQTGATNRPAFPRRGALLAAGTVLLGVLVWLLAA